MADEPILLFLLRGILHVLGWICSIFAGPTALFFRSTQPVVLSKHFDSQDPSALLHAVLAPLRWVCLPLAVVLFSTAWFPTAVWFILEGNDDQIGFMVGSVFAGLFMQIYGIIYLRRHVASCAEIRFGEYFLSCADSLLDALALVCGIVGLCSVLQWPMMVHIFAVLFTGQRQHLESKSLRIELMLQPLEFLLDVCLLLGWIALLLCPWRWGVTQQILRSEATGRETWHTSVCSIPLKLVLAFQGVCGAFDVFTMVFCAVLTLPVPWRLVMMLQIGCNPPLRSTRQAKVQRFVSTCWKQTFHGMLDLLCIIISIPGLVTLYRVPYTIGEIYHRLKLWHHNCHNKVRWALCNATIGLFTDIFFVLSTILVCLFGYRIPQMWRTWKVQWPRRSWDEHDIQFRSIAVGLQQLVDIPFLIIGLALSFAVWRTPFFWRRLYRADTAHDRYRIVWENLVWTCVDLVLDIWFAAMALIITVTVVRAFRLAKDTKVFYKIGDNLDDPHTRCQLRGLIGTHMLLWILDLPAVALSLVIIFTFWRAYRLILLLIKGDTKEQDFEAEFEQSLPPAAAQNVRRGVDRVELFATHRIVAREFLFWLMDILVVPFLLVVIVSWRSVGLVKSLIALWKDPDTSFGERVHVEVMLAALQLAADVPFVLLGILSLWRIPLLIRYQCTSCTTDWQRRTAAAKYFGYMLLDIPCAVGLVLLHTLGLLCVWRAAQFWTSIGEFKQGDSEHLLVGVAVLRMAQDVPFVLLGAITAVLAPWRAWDLIQDVRLAPKQDESPYGVVCIKFGMAILDWLCGIMALVVVCTLVRIPSLVHGLHNYHKRKTGLPRCTVFYQTAATCCALLLMDIFSIIPLLGVLLGIVRVPALVYRLVRVFRAVEAHRVYERAARRARERARARNAARPAAAGPTSPVSGSVVLMAADSDAGVARADLPVDAATPASPMLDRARATSAGDLGARARKLSSASEAGSQPGSDAGRSIHSDSSATAALVGARPLPAAAAPRPPRSPVSDLPDPRYAQAAFKLFWIASGVTSDWKLASNVFERDNEIPAWEGRLPPRSWSIAIPIVLDEWTWTLAAWTQLLRLPLKLAAAVLWLPVRAVAFRFHPGYKPPAKYPLENPRDGSGAAMALDLLGELYFGIWASLSFLRLDNSVVAQACVLATWAIHDIALLPAFVNVALMTIICFGAPLGWGKALAAGSATHYARFERIVTVLFIFQMFLMLVFVAVQPFLLAAPLLVYNSDIAWSAYEASGDTSEFWSDWWGSIPAAVWVVQALWTVSMALSYYFVHKARKRWFTFQLPQETGVHTTKRNHIAYFAPVWCYVWVLTHVFKGRIWGLYKQALGQPTSWLRTWRNACLKNLALIVLFFVWCGWPLVVAGLIRIVWLWIPCILITLFLMWRGYVVVEANWKSPVASPPQLQLRHMSLALPDAVRKPNGSLSYRRAILRFEAGKSSTFGPNGSYRKDGKVKIWPDNKMFQVELEVEGEAFWGEIRGQVGRVAVSIARNLGFHPFNVCPKYLDPLSIEQEPDRWRGEIDIDLRDARRRPNFGKLLQQLANRGDSQFTLHFHFGFERRGKYKRAGKLFSVQTRASELWASADNGTAFFPPARGGARAGAGAGAGAGTRRPGRIPRGGGTLAAAGAAATANQASDDVVRIEVLG